MDKLRDTYGGASGSTTVFNLWRQLTQARVDKSTLMAHQLAKINETCIALTNASMGITDNQFCLILLHALPNSYEVLASTILASGAPDKLKHSKIITWIINEERANLDHCLTQLRSLQSNLAVTKRKTTLISLVITATKRGISNWTAEKRKRMKGQKGEGERVGQQGS